MGVKMYYLIEKILRPLANALGLRRYMPKMSHQYLGDIEIQGIDTTDYPDFSDAYISYATYMGRECTDLELEELNEDSDLVYEETLNKIF